MSIIDTVKQNSSTKVPSDLTWRLRKVLHVFLTRTKLADSESVRASSVDRISILKQKANEKSICKGQHEVNHQVQQPNYAIVEHKQHLYI